MKKTLVVCSLVFLAVMACGDSDSPSGPTGWNNGSWTGETATEIPITFTLDHPAISSWTMITAYEYADTTDSRTWLCQSITVAADSTFSWADTVDNDTLKYVISFSGTFNTGDSLTGAWDSSVEYHLSGGHSGIEDISGSWTAKGPQ